MWHLKPFSSRHCFSHIWQNQRSFWSPFDFMLFEIHFGVPFSAFPILILLCSYSLFTGVLKFFVVLQTFLYQLSQNEKISNFGYFCCFLFLLLFCRVIKSFVQKWRISLKKSLFCYYVRQIMIWKHFVNKKGHFFQRGCRQTCRARAKAKMPAILWKKSWLIEAWMNSSVLVLCERRWIKEVGKIKKFEIHKCL